MTPLCEPALLLALVLGAPQADPLAPVQWDETAHMDPEVVALIAEHATAVQALLDDRGSGGAEGGERALAEAHGELGLVYEGNFMWAPARKSYEKALSLLPERALWWYRVGVCRHAAGDLEEALAAFGTAAAALPDLPLVHMRLADAHMTFGELDAAESAWKAALEAEERTQPVVRYPTPRVGLAQVKLELGELDTAERLLKEALALSPGYRHAQYTLGLVYRELGRDEESRLALRRGLNASPAYPPDPDQERLSRYAVGYYRNRMKAETLLYDAGQIEPAIAMIEGMLKERPQDHRLINLLADAHQRKGDLARTEELLLRSEAAFPGDYHTYVLWTGVLRTRANAAALPEDKQTLLEAALVKADRAVALAPTLGDPYHIRGLVWLQLARPGDPHAGELMQSAMKDMNQAQALGCKTPQLYEALAKLYGQMGRAREMLQFAQGWVDRQPEDPRAWLFAANAHLVSADLAAAGAAATNAERLAGSDPGVSSAVAEIRAAIEQARMR